MAYIGPPVLVADVVLWPDRSIIKQSYDARERKMDANLPSHLAYGNLNGDGFGIGWYTERASQGSRRSDEAAADTTPCVFTSITPAWWGPCPGLACSNWLSSGCISSFAATQRVLSGCLSYEPAVCIWVPEGLIPANAPAGIMTILADYPAKSSRRWCLHMYALHHCCCCCLCSCFVKLQTLTCTALFLETQGKDSSCECK